MATERMKAVGTLDQIVGWNVRSLREHIRPKKSQEWLGGADGVGLYLGYTLPKQVVSRIERGERSLDARELVALALVLRVSVTDLLTAHVQLDDRHEVQISTDPESPWLITVEELREAVLGRKQAGAVRDARRALFSLIANEAAQLASAAAQSDDPEAFDPAYYSGLPYGAETVLITQPKARGKKR
jgi:transcriptional regulator with XRE-family HTH domain